MNVNAVKTGFLGSVFAIAAVSCDSPQERGRQEIRNKALPYLSGKEVYLTDSISKGYSGSYGSANSPRIVYWDSIIADGKAKEAYSKGFQMIRDSAAGKEVIRPEYTMPINQRISRNANKIVENLKQEAASMRNGEEFNKLLEKEPNLDFVSLISPRYVHYYGLLIRTGKEREAFNKGAEDARKELK